MRLPYLAVVGILLVGCTPVQTTPTEPVLPTPVPQIESGTTMGQTFTSPYGFSLTYPATMPPSTTFSTDYLTPDVWSLFDGEGVEGEKIAEFLVPGSNEVTAAGLRIGASKVAVDSCLMRPDYGQFQKTSRVLSGQNFTVLTLADAAMSHYREVRSMRIVHNGACLVFDEFVSGTNPDVYDPPRTPPFTKEEGFSRVDALLNTLVLQ